LAYVTGCDLTEGCRQPQRSSCGERPLDELATALTGVKIHGWEALIVQTVLRIGRMYPPARPRIVYESAQLSYSWRITGKPEVDFPIADYTFTRCATTIPIFVPNSRSGRKQSQTERPRQFDQLCGRRRQRTFCHG